MKYFVKAVSQKEQFANGRVFPLAKEAREVEISYFLLSKYNWKPKCSHMQDSMCFCLVKFKN